MPTSFATVVPPPPGLNVPSHSGQHTLIATAINALEVFVEEQDTARSTFAFNWGDASPKTLRTVLSGELVVRVEIHLAIAFDGAGAELKVGDAGDSGRLLAVTDNDPAASGVYGVTPSYAYGADTPLILTITPGGGASQGSGVLVIVTQR